MSKKAIELILSFTMFLSAEQTSKLLKKYFIDESPDTILNIIKNKVNFEKKA